MASYNSLRGSNAHCSHRRSNPAQEKLISSSLEQDGHQPSSSLCSRRKASPTPQPRLPAETEHTNSNSKTTTTVTCKNNTKLFQAPRQYSSPSPCEESTNQFISSHLILKTTVRKIPSISSFNWEAQESFRSRIKNCGSRDIQITTSQTQEQLLKTNSWV